MLRLIRLVNSLLYPKENINITALHGGDVAAESE